MNDNAININLNNKDTSTTTTWSSSNGTYFVDTLNKLDWNTPAVALLEFPGASITITLNKKLNLIQRMCYNVLGFKYKTL